MISQPRPPRLADALLKRVLPTGKSGASILGDLREEFHEMAGGDANGSRARRWYWQQALRLTLRYFTQPAHSPQLSRPRRSPMLMDLTSDVRTAVRMTVRNPGTSSLIVFTLAIAIAAATIGFAFADLALFRGLPVDDPARVVSVFASDTRGSNPRARVSAPDLLDYRARTTTLERLSALRDGRVPLIRNGQSQTLAVSYATANVFDSMGQSALVGRAFTEGDDAPGAPPVAVLAHHYWRDEMEGRADAIGRTLQIGRQFVAVVGVLSPDIEFGNLGEADLWLPMVLDPNGPRDARNLRFIARLREGVTFDQAAAEIAAIGDALANEYPLTNGGWALRLIPIRDLTGGQGFWVVIALFLLSIGLLIAIATANVSNLIMVRAAGRARELAVRTAMGARGGRLLRQFLTEGLLLSGIAAALSIPAAWTGLQAIGVFSPEPVFQQLRIDWHELGFVATLALVCPVMFSLASARMVSKPDLRQVLATQGSRGSTATMKGRSVLVVAQVALAVILLTVSTLAVRSIRALYAAPIGIETSGLLVFSLGFDEVQYPVAAEAAAAARATYDAVAALPGVQAISIVTPLPALDGEALASFTIDGVPIAPGMARPQAVFSEASDSAAATLRLTTLAGAWWSPGATDNVVISRQTAMRYFHGIESALDRHITIVRGDEPVSLRVIGVVNDVSDGTRIEQAPPRVWTPLAEGGRRFSYVARALDLSQLSRQVREVLASTAPAVPIEGLASFDAALELEASSDYVVIGVLAGFAILALVLATTGLFGLVSFAVAQRTAEFGTRIALGASTWNVVRLVLRQSMALLIVGLSVGLGGGVGVGFMMGSVLYGTSPTDPVTLIGVAALLAVVTLIATALPAWRASRIDPVTALRAE